ncbi:MAG: NTP transferase domain-containing protein [Deltaproteobacteria bacterium]|jgi:bifunctional UDP-N-acetylglucosamine pyrophosphorylase/glucosamine-1-phosphate N-acetyltransferase|nr:NTP transferase domain-containing protein [Deltaproteobacteria bacterium]
MAFKRPKEQSERSHPISVIVLAGGQGKRMKSSKPKVLHEIMGKSLLAHVLNAVRYLSPVKTVVVVGYRAEDVQRSVGDDYNVTFARQERPAGTGDAVRAAEKSLEAVDGDVLIVPGDVPLLSPQTLLDFRDAYFSLENQLSVLTVEVVSPGAYGRVIRDPSGWIDRIVEFTDATESERLVREINSGVYLADKQSLFAALQDLQPDNNQNEFYLTDIVEIFRVQGKLVSAIMGPDPQEVQGVNDRAELATVLEILRIKINNSWVQAGVTLEDTFTTLIEPGVKLEPDVTLAPGVILKGQTRVGKGAHIGPYTVVSNSVIGPEAQLGPHLSLNGARVPPGARVFLPNPPIHSRLKIPPQRRF